MSTLDNTRVPPVTGNTAVLYRLSEIIRKDETWQVLDQAAVSGGNFLTTLMLARTFTPGLYGIFSLLYLALFSINTCHASLVVYPLTIQAATAERHHLGKLAGQAILRTLLLAPVEAVAMVAVAVFVQRLDLVPILIVTMVAWQLQETARRALLAHRRSMLSFFPDTMSYVGQGLAILILKPRSLTEVFTLISVTSCLAAAYQLWLVRVSLRTAFQGDHFAHSWDLGRYTLAGNVLNMVTLQLPAWAVNIFAGHDAVAGFAALQNPIGIANPIIFSLSNMLIPAIARSSRQGQAAARSTMFRYGLGLGTLLLPCFAILLIAPRFTMTFVYGAGSPYLVLAPLLRILTIALIFQYGATVVGAYEGGSGRPYSYMWVQVAGTAALATVGIWLIRRHGIQGAVLGMFTASVIRMAVFSCLSIYNDARHTKATSLAATLPSGG